MKNILEKYKENKSISTQGGFLSLIILIVVALFIMKYFGITISGIINWFASFFSSVLK